NTYQLLEYVNRLASILNRQHLCIDPAGAIKGLLNLNEIKDKWEELKRELMQVNPIAAFEVVKQKDRELANPVMLIDNMANAHFMYLFTQAYGIVRNQIESVDRETLQRDRMGIGFMVPITQSFQVASFDGEKHIKMKSTLDERKKIDKALLVQVTGHEAIDLKHFSSGEFRYTADNQLILAKMHIFEQLNAEFSV